VDTRLTPEQAELQRSARQLAHELGPSQVADLDDTTRAKRLAGAVRDAGWLELRDDDGSGAPLASGVEAAVVADALGERVTDVAFTGPVLGADLARRAGVSERAVVAFGPSLIGIAGETGVALDGADHDYALVLLPSNHLGRVALGAPSDGTDLSRALRPTIGPPELIGGSLSDDDLAGWEALGLALTSADLVGVMRGVLEVSVAYAAERKQFGVPVGSFQAVQHLLAEACCLLEGSRSIALYAAWAVDSLDPFAALLAGRRAKAYCARAARTVCETAVQVHGGIGNTWECMVHVYLRRALLSSQWFGDDAVQLAELSNGLS
jgi:alkylation response protein AidB-like acyl-CoA dehydrogenase